MFSQLRQAVESFAPQVQNTQARRSLDVSADDLRTHAARARSPDDHSSNSSMSLSSSQLAESALTNLRKSLASQRSSSPSSSRIPKSSSSPDVTTRKSTLEDRLRATFTIGDVSNHSSAYMSSRASPTPMPVVDHPLSPKSTPLPDSPAVSPTASTDVLPTFSNVISFAPEVSAVPPAPVTEEEAAPQNISLQSQTSSVDADPLKFPEADIPSKLPEADIPLPPSPQEDSQLESNDAQKASFDTSEESSDQAVTGKSNDIEDSSDQIVTGESHDLEDISTQPTTSAEGAGEIGHPSDVPVTSDVSSSEVKEADTLDILAEKMTVLDELHIQSNENDVEVLQQRLKLVEQRFADVSTSFKRLQAERLAADSVIRELTPLEGVRDVEVLRDYLQNLNLKTEIAQDEIRRLNGKLTRQEERIDELRDTHRLESASQSDQIDRLRKQLEEAEGLLGASHASTSQLEEESKKSKAAVERLNSEVEKATSLAKEEEEKRVKAISLLKTVRQKLVKAEKDRDDAVKELTDAKEREKQDRERTRGEQAKLQSQLETMSVERERTVSGLKMQFEKELALAREQSEKELVALKGHSDLELATLKSSHVQELLAKNSHISSLENSISKLSAEKNTLFEQLQVRQAELESSQYHAESLQSQNTELQFQMRELQERVTLMSEELGEVRSAHDMRSSGPAVSTEEYSQMVSSMEAKYEAKLAELKKTLHIVERERDDSEAEWSRKLREKMRETEDLRRIVQSSAKTREEEEEALESLRAMIARLQTETEFRQKEASELKLQIEQLKDSESHSSQDLAGTKILLTSMEKQVEESKVRETQLRTQIKMLREELRKVQSSAALLEKQRNPGVGYWTSRQEITASESRTSVSSDVSSRSASPGNMSSPSTKNDEEVNLEYLRNVILQFLEHKEMRPNLVKVLSIILHFTPQETRRLIAKV